VCGDNGSDPELMLHLGASLKREMCKTYDEFVSPDAPRIILNKLATLGYRVVGQSGPGQTCIWTLWKD